MSERIVPFHCPYCGEEQLRPHETAEGSPHGSWECRSCMRAFSIRFLGLLRHSGVQTSQPLDSSTPGGDS